MTTKVVAYTDGSSIGTAPWIGAGGWAFVLNYYENNKKVLCVESGNWLDTATNNIAGLTAILKALEFVYERQWTMNVTIVTDSRYCEGLLLRKDAGWEFNARKNVMLVHELRKKALSMQSFAIQRVKGHSDTPENCRADVIAGTCRQNKVCHFKEVEVCPSL